MSVFNEILKDRSGLLEMEPEELGAVILEHLVEGAQLARQNEDLSVHNFDNDLQHGGHDEAVRGACMEGWSWLVREGLIVPKGIGGGDWHRLSRRAQQLKTRKGVEAYRKQMLLPRGSLHARITIGVWADFARGDYDAAVFKAFKEVEVRVREAAGQPPEAIGVKLMREAFKPGGPLAASKAPLSEQEALMHLFSGAIGSYKNPSSHRHVPLDAQQASEMIVLASHLLGIVDSRDQADTQE